MARRSLPQRIVESPAFPGPWIVVLVLCLSAGCGGGGGGGASSLSLIGVQTDSGALLPDDGLYLNERLTFVFSEPVDPATVSADAIRIRHRRIIDGRVQGEAFTVSPRGTFSVLGERVVFIPTIPSRGDASDAGFIKDTLYRIEIASAKDSDAVRSFSGAGLAVSGFTTFKTRAIAPLVLDPVPGPPSVVAVALDLNGDGVLDADGDPATENDEEFLSFESMPFAVGVPVGLARRPTRVVFFMSEPILAASVLPSASGSRAPANAFLFDVNRSTRLPARVEVIQEYQAERERFDVRIVITPATTLPPGARIEPTLSSIEDLAFRRLGNGLLRTGFETRFGPDRFEDAFVEGFDDRHNMDPSTTADWAVADSSVLAPGLGLGGNGADGELNVPRDATVRLDTEVNNGFFHFTDLQVEEGGVLDVVGPNPLVLFVQGNADISGTIDLSGTRGEDGTAVVGDRPARPGLGVAGGTDGGVGGVFGFIPGGGPGGVGGGEGGHSNLGNPGGGGGGGHAFIGGSFSTVGNRWAGLGGGTYGTPTIQVLYPGSGGGGGGNYRVGTTFGAGGGGGAGGGAIAFSVAGEFLLSASGSIVSNGGDGGNGAPGGTLFGAGGGGGGSGGSIRIRAASVAPLDQVGARLQAQGGAGGRVGGGFIGPGGGGADGRIFIQTLDRNGDGQANDFEIDPTAAQISPPLVKGLLVVEDLGHSVALSRFLDTGARNPRFGFDGNDPETGILRSGAGVTDLVMRGDAPPGATMSILFQGAHEDPTRPRNPDLSTLTEFTPRVDELDGYPFLRYRLDFDLGGNLERDLRPVIEELRIRFEFDI